MESNQSRFYNKVFYVYLLDEIALLIQFLYDFGGMSHDVFRGEKMEVGRR